MNWVSKNKFPVAIFAILLTCGSILGFLSYSSWNRYSATLESFQQQSARLLQLQGLNPYPNAENLAKYKEQQEILNKSVDNLRSTLVAMQVPMTLVKPEEFQDRLRVIVSMAVAEADKQKVTIADRSKFYLGFGEFQFAPPKAEDASLLAVHLKAAESLVKILFVSCIDELRDFKVGSDRDRSQAKPASGTKLELSPKAASVLSRTPFEMSFLCDPSALRRVLNAISSTNEQFFVIRDVFVENTNDKGPSRMDASASTASVVSGENSQAPVPMKFVVGTEKIKVLLKLELVQFPKES